MTKITQMHILTPELDVDTRRRLLLLACALGADQDTIHISAGKSNDGEGLQHITLLCPKEQRDAIASHLQEEMASENIVIYFTDAHRSN